MKYKLQVGDHQGRQLEVLQELPDKGDKFPTVLMVPGFGNDLHEFGFFDEVSTTLVRNGMQTLRFSYAGVGNSQGDFSQSNVEDMIEQYKSVLEYTLKDRFTIKGSFGVLAHQFGTCIVLGAQQEDPIASFVFTSAIADPEDVISRWYRRQRAYNPDGISSRDRSNRTTTSIGSNFWPSTRRFNFISLARKLEKPSLFIHGGRDQYVKGNQAYLLYEAAAGRKKFHLIEKADHGFTGIYRDTAINLIVERFIETLHP